MAFGDGRLLIDRDGSVAEVALERQLNSSIREVVAQRMRSWRFEPIVEPGCAVRAEAHMRFRIEAEFDAYGNAERLGIADVDFYTPKGIADPDRLAERTPPSRYPKRQLRDGFGAALELQVEVGADGRVLRSAAQRIELYNRAARLDDEQKAAAGFVAASQAAIADWRFKPAPNGQAYRVTVPINFMLNAPWHRVHPVALQPAAWTLQGEIAAAHQLGPDGAAADPRVRLLDESAAGG